MRLEGLTAQQVKICNRLWDCNTNEEVAEYVRRLPQRLQQEAQVLIDLMILEAIDEQVESMEEYPAAEQLMSRLKG
jgi:predicted DNA-binding protein